MAPAVGVELGAAHVRALALERTGTECRVTAVQEAACNTANPEALAQALSQLRRTLPITQPVVLGLPAAAAFLTTLEPLVVVPGRADLAIRFELQHLLPFDVADAAWDAHWLYQAARRAPGDGAAGSRRAVVMAMRHPILQERLAACRRAGITVRAVSSIPCALLNAWRAQHPGTAATVLLQVADGEATWIAASPTAMTVAAVSLPQEASGPGGAEALLASWEAVHAQLPETPERVGVVGLPEALASAERALAAQGLRVERLDAGRLVRNARVPQPERWAAAVGLGLQGLGQASLAMNLLAESQEAARVQRIRRVSAMVHGAALAAAVGLALSGMWAVHRRQQAVVQALERRHTLYQQLRPEVRALVQQQHELEQRSAQLQRLLDEAPTLAWLLVRATGAMPDMVWLTKVEWSRDPIPQGLLEGRARNFQDLTEFVERLKKIEGIANAKPLSTTVSADPASGREEIVFAVQCQAAAPAPASEAAEPETTE